MLTAYVVPYLEGDIQDENHIRVEHWGIDLSGRQVLLVEKDLRTYGYRVDQTPREIRCVSAMWGRKSPSPTILLHLKKVPSRKAPTSGYVWPLVQCKDLDTAAILRVIEKRGRFPTCGEYVFHNQELTITPGHRLMKRKEANLIRRGYVSSPDRYKAKLTVKGIQYLEKHRAGE